MKAVNMNLKLFCLVLSLLVVIFILAHAAEQKYDESTPMEELKAAANEGDTEAMLEYGMRLLQSNSDSTNVKEAFDWFQKAADAGDAQAWYAFGVVYLNNMGVEYNLDKALEYLQKGADAGDSDCQTSLGMIYQAGEKIPGGKKADGAKAAKYYQMAAEQDHTEAIWHLAGMLARGIGVDQNEKEAVVWLNRGADLGSGDCIWGLGRCYLNGNGVEVDSVMAYSLMCACLDGINFPEQKKAIMAKRDELGKSLSEEQLKQSEPIIKEWEAKLASK